MYYLSLNTNLCYNEVQFFFFIKSEFILERSEADVSLVSDTYRYYIQFFLLPSLK